jgi:hypothetical protein
MVKEIKGHPENILKISKKCNISKKKFTKHKIWQFFNETKYTYLTTAYSSHIIIPEKGNYHICNEINYQ